MYKMTAHARLIFWGILALQVIQLFQGIVKKPIAIDGQIKSLLLLISLSC